ncbi:hypothetical protein HDU89_003723 [Geranomyces variabilis]|nr:hypothetical protein HDU89_003723 [Geranomyces variabilis]
MADYYDEATRELAMSDSLKAAVRGVASWPTHLFDPAGFRHCTRVARAAEEAAPIYIVNNAMAELQREAYLVYRNGQPLPAPVAQEAEDEEPEPVVRTPLIDEPDREFELPGRTCAGCMCSLMHVGADEHNVLLRCASCESANSDPTFQGPALQYELCVECFERREAIHPPSHTFRQIPMPVTKIVATVASYFECSRHSRPHDAVSMSVLAADDAVPNDLRRDLAQSLNAIAAKGKNEFHPWTNGKVLDVIHPSFFPFVKGVSHVVDHPLYGENEDEDDEDDEYDGETNRPPPPVRRPSLPHAPPRISPLLAKYHWLPSDVQVSPEGAVRFASPIPQLDGPQHVALHAQVAALLTGCIPLWERTLSQPLAGRRLQVVVKAVNYLLAPGQTHEGHWQLEGLPGDRILASAIYCYESAPEIRDFGLAFRARRDRVRPLRFGCANTTHVRDLVLSAATTHHVPLFTDLDAALESELVVAAMEEHHHCTDRSFEIGACPTRQGRLLVFPNGNVQHRIAGLKNMDRRQSDAASIPATISQHKTLSLYLVDPAVRVRSTRTVPPQQWERIRPGVARCVAKAAQRALGNGRGLPGEMVEKIVGWCKWGMTMQEARAHRICLTRERRVYVDAINAEWEAQGGAGGSVLDGLGDELDEDDDEAGGGQP